MRRITALLAALVLALSLLSCGSSEGGSKTPSGNETASGKEEGTSGAADTEPESTSAIPETEPEPTAVQRDMKEDYRYDYPEGIVLLDDEYVRITAERLFYRETTESASGRRLAFYLNVENKTDSELIIAKREDYAEALNANDSGTVFYHTDEWNGLVGETDDCCQGTFEIDIKKKGEKGGYTMLDAVRFDWYVSEETPFFNVITGAERAAAAKKAAELAELSALTPLYHAENEMLSVDIVKAEAAHGRYKVTYIAENKSASPIYVLPQSDPSNGKTDYEIYNDFWKEAIVCKTGERWFKTESYYAERAFADGPAELTVTVYNAIRQVTAELTFAVTAPETFPEEPTEKAGLKFEESGSTADTNLAAAYTDIRNLKPFFTVENEALRWDLLATYTEYNKDYEYYTGKAVYALTNLTGQDLYLGQTAIASGETLYGTEDTGYSDNGDEGNVIRSMDVKASKDSSQSAASVGFSCNWTFDASAKEIGASDFKVSESWTWVDQDVLSGDSVYYTYSNLVAAENEYYRVEIHSMSGKKNKDGTWNVNAEFWVYNTYTDKYLMYDPGKISAEWLQYLEWIEPEKGSNFRLSFTAKGAEPDIFGNVSFEVNGWTMNGIYSSKLFESTVNVKLRLAKSDPVVSAEIK